MNQSNTQSNILRNWRETPAFYGLLMITFLSLALYVTFISKTIFTLVADRQLESENKSLATDISKLELQTLALNDSISIEKAYSMGFVSASTAEYVAPALALSSR